MNQAKCAHPYCGCTVERAGEYCAPECRSGLTLPDSRECGCPHPDCAAGAHRSAPPAV
jgi:hypothetical protein